MIKNSQEDLDIRSSTLASYGVIPSDVLARTDISADSKTIYCVITATENHYGFSPVDNARIMTVLGLTEERVEECLADMHGKIISIQYFNGSRRLYTVTKEHQATLEKRLGPVEAYPYGI